MKNRQGFKRARHEVLCLCCCCCNPSVWKYALLTQLSVRISHSPCLCVVSSRLLSKERSSLCACFRVTQLVLFRCLFLARYRGNHVESRVAQERACCASSRTPGGATREVQRKRLTSYHGSCLPGAMTQKSRGQQKEWKCGECQRWTCGRSKMLALWKQRLC